MISSALGIWNYWIVFLLMMIGPNEWGKKGCPINFISSVKLLADHTWEVIK